MNDTQWRIQDFTNGKGHQTILADFFLKTA